MSLSWSASASAQDRPVEVPETIVESIQPEGVPLGAFVLYPRLSADLRYDTNVYNRSGGGQDDAVFVVRPAVRLATDLPRHGLTIDLAGEGRRYFENSSENSEQWAAAANGRLDLADRFVLSANAGVAERIERRGTLGDEFLTDRPVSYQEIVAGLGLARRGGILEWALTAGTRRQSYDDATQNGVPIDLSFRDVNRDTVSWRADYRGFPRLGLMARVTGTRLRYDDLSQRNSKGISVIAGVTYRVTDLIDVEAGAGFIHHKPRDPSRPAINAFDYSVAGNWTPTPRTRFTIAGARSVERSPLPDVNDVLESTLELGGVLAVGTRTSLGLNLGAVRDEYRGIDRRETRYYAEATARYLIAPKLSALVGAGYRQQVGEGVDSRDYHGATIRAGIVTVF